MDDERAVIDHYTTGYLGKEVRGRLAAVGFDSTSIDPDELAGLEEFHVGGSEAAQAVARGVGMTAASRVLDIGAGIGGPARLFARRFGATVHGIDITPFFVSVAEALTRQAGLSGRVTFSIGNGLAIPFERGEFDVVTMMHVGMNVADKPRLFAEAHRVLRRGGRFAVYDLMRVGDGKVAFPIKWSSVPSTSFLGTPGDYEAALAGAGFTVEAARRFDYGRLPEPKTDGSGADVRLRNMIDALQSGIIAPVQIFTVRDGAA